VANLDVSREIINPTSSQGPTRDGRSKPDVAAPGTGIVAAKGFSQDDSKWVSMSGTSMAAPYVAGVIALMLSINGRLTAAQIEGIIQSTAQPLPGGNYKWIDSAGFGRIDPDGCLAQATAVNDRVEVSK
jgi:subtilisin family serine protease